jgi:hypothetical protein
MAISNSPLTPKEIQDLKQLTFDLKGIKIPDIDKFVIALGGVANARKELGELKKQFANIDSDVENIYNNLKNITNELKKGNEGYKATLSSVNRLSSISSKLKADADGIDVLNEKDIKSLISKIKLEQTVLTNAKELNTDRLAELKLKDQVSFLTASERTSQKNAKIALELNNKLLFDEKESYQSLVALAGRRLTFERDINDTLGVTGNLAKGLEKVLGKIGLGGLMDLDDINAKIRLTAESTVRTAEANGRNVSLLDKGKVAMTTLVETSKGLAEALDDPALLFAAIVDLSLQADKQTTDLAKSMMLTKFQAQGVRQEFVQMSEANNDIFVTTDKLIEANTELGKQLGFNKIFSEDIDSTFVRLTKIIGVSNESAGNLAKISITSGKSFTSIVQTIAGTTSLLSHQNGVQIDGKEILEETGKIHGQIALNLKNNPSLIAAAIIQTKLLGTSLETAKGQSEFLLDFESSITAELKAELITGQQLNLEKARSFALSGNLVGVAKELNSQGLTYAKYQQMNVIAQKAYAESLGLTSDQLSDQLLQQDAIGKSKTDIAAIDGKDAAKRLEQLSAEDKFNAAIEKLKDLLGNIVAGPGGALLDLLSNILGVVGLIGKPFALINKWIDEATGGASGLATALKDVAAIAAVASAFIFGPWWTLAGLAAAGAAIALVESIPSSKGNDVISPGTGGAGYGNRTLFGPEGAIQLNDKDTVIAGTNLDGGLTQAASSSTPSSQSDSSTSTNVMVDLTPLIKAMEDVRMAVDRLASKESTINMDGKKVGSTLVQGSYKVA